jgi:hypothetical protein
MSGCSGQVIAGPVSVFVVAKPVSKPITIASLPTGGTASVPLCTTVTNKVLTIGTNSTGTIQWQSFVSPTILTPAQLATAVWATISDATGTNYTVANPEVGVNYFRASFTNTCNVVVFSAAVPVHYKDCSAPLREVATKEKFEVKAYPNPYTETFNLSLTTSSEDKVSVVVYDMTGRLIERREVRPSDMVEQQIGDRYPSGVYNIVVTQGEEVKTLRVIKR